jgi:hypothetical protein
MTTAMYITVAVVAILVIAFVVRPMIRSFRKYSGPLVVECPDNHNHAAVEVNKSAALQSAFGTPKLELDRCSRWPEKSGCGQECLRQIEAQPEDCLVRNILTRWYEGKSCVVCHKPLEEIDWQSRKPALMGPENETREWNEIPPEAVPSVLQTHQPICWDCHIALKFHQEHGDRVVERNWKKEDYYPTGQ